MAIKLRPRWVSVKSKSNSKPGGGGGGDDDDNRREIKWEMRPGGMLVQKRESRSVVSKEMIRVKVSTRSRLHEISIDATSTFGELKVLVSMATGLEPREQRLLFKGKEREDSDHLHMVGVGEMDKVVLFGRSSYQTQQATSLSIYIPTTS